MIIDDDITFKRRNRRYYGLESNMEKSKRDFIDSDYDDMIQSFEQKHDEGIILCGTRLEYMPPAPEASSDVGGGVYNAYSIDGQIFSEFIDDIDSTNKKKIKKSLENIKKEIKIVCNRFETTRNLLFGSRVLILGPANAGKSSFFNFLLQDERMIISPEKGTTTDQAEQSIEINGNKVTIIDSAGIRNSKKKIEKHRCKIW